MKELDHSMAAKVFWKYREDVLKKERKGRLEKYIDDYLKGSGVKYHRKFPVRIGNGKHRKRHVVSFWIEGKGIILDIYSEGQEMSVYDPGRRVDILFCPKGDVKFIAPVDEKMRWPEVRRQLDMIMGL